MPPDSIYTPIDRTSAKEVVQVLKTIPDHEAVLFYLYKSQHSGDIDYTTILKREMKKAGINIDAVMPGVLDKDGRPVRRLNLSTWGNETSLNDYVYCSHVFLVGILHRRDTDLMASYLAQTGDIKGEVNKTIANELQISEKSHLAYQALSRGTCRTVNDGKALSMTGYIVEIDPEIETTLNQVMPGVVWKKWTPYFVEESVGLIDTWKGKVLEYLAGLDADVDHISSQSLKKSLRATKVAPRTWATIIESVRVSLGKMCIAPKEGRPLKDHCTSFPWTFEGKSFIRQTAERFGFTKEVA